MGNATRASRGKPHIFLTVENRVGPASRFRDSQSTAQPLRLHFGLGFYSFGLFCNLIRLNSLIIGFLFVVPLPCYVASSIPNITVRDLPFTTLGCRYPRPDFHRLDVRHARRTKREQRHHRLHSDALLCVPFKFRPPRSHPALYLHKCLSHSPD